MASTIVARWQVWSGEGLQHLVLKQGPHEIVAEPAVTGATEAGAPLSAWFRIARDGAWRVRRVEAGVVGDERRIRLASDGDGRTRCYSVDSRILPIVVRDCSSRCASAAWASGKIFASANFIRPEPTASNTSLARRLISSWVRR